MSNTIGLPSADGGTLQINVNYDWNNLETLKVGDEKLDDATRQRETHALLVELGYSFSKKFSLDLFLPFIRQDRTITTRATPDKESTEGIGDIVILPKYEVNDHLTVGVGIKLPTGRADFLNERGIALTADLQPGSGALDGILWVSYQRYHTKRPSLGFFGSGIFRKTGVNSNYFAGSSYQFGNELQLSAGLSDRFLLGSKLIDPSLRVLYRKRGRDFFDEEEFPGSGGDFLFVNPGISFPLGARFSWQLNASVPVYAYVQDTQLAPTIQINTGLSFKTNLKTNKSIKL